MDIFVSDPQYLGFVSPRLSDVAEAVTHDYVDRRKELRKQVFAGTDPVQAKKLEREAHAIQSSNTFERVARKWFEHWGVNKQHRHAEYVIRRLEVDEAKGILVGALAVLAVLAVHYGYSR